MEGIGPMFDLLLDPAPWPQDALGELDRPGVPPLPETRQPVEVVRHLPDGTDEPIQKPECQQTEPY